MRGVVFRGERELELMEFPDPTPGPGEVVIEMKASGMCGSDLHAYRTSRAGGGMGASLGLGGDGSPVIAGHEPCGVVAARGAGVSEKQAPTGMRGIPLKKLITERYRLEQAAEAYRLFDTQTTGKGVFVF